METFQNYDEQLDINRHQCKSIVSGLICDPRQLEKLSIDDVCDLMKNDLSDSLAKDFSALKISSKGVDESTEIPIIRVSDHSAKQDEIDRSLLPDNIEDCRNKSYYERLMIAGENKNYLKPPGYDLPTVKHKSFNAAYMFKFRKNAHVKPSSFLTYFTSERKNSQRGFQRSTDKSRVIKNKFSIKPRLQSLNKYSLMPDQTYRLGQTMLYRRSLPATKLKATNIADSSPRDRLTILFCSNFNGTHKLKPLVIGSSSDPRVIKNFEAFVVYKYSKDAQITEQILHEWFYENFVSEVNSYIQIKGLPQRSMLFLDPSVNKHPPMEQLNFEKFQIKTLKLSANIAVDQTIVGLARMEYKKRLLLDVVAMPHAFTKLCDAIAIIRLAWDTVKPFSIEKCCRYVLPSEDNSKSPDWNPTAMIRSMHLQRISKIEIVGLLNCLPGGKDLLDSELDSWIYTDDGLIIDKNPFF